MRHFLFITLFLAVITAEAKHQEPIVYIDMRYTLRADYRDSVAVVGVWDDLHTISALQGIVNRDKPRLYIEYIETNGRSIDAYWWNRYRSEGEWLYGRDTLRLQSVEEAVRYFQPLLKGVVAYDSNVASTSNVASSVAGVENLLPLRWDASPQSLYQRLISGKDAIEVQLWLVNTDGSSLFTGKGKIPGTDRISSGSQKCDPYLWLLERYMKTGRMDGRFAGYYQDQLWRKKPLAAPTNHHTLTNHDFFISRKGFFFDLSPWPDEATDEADQPTGTDYRTLCEMLKQAHTLRHGASPCYIGGFPEWAYKYTKRTGGKHADVDTEWQFAELISRYMAFKDADAIGYGALANASFWQHFPLKKRYPQPWTSKKKLKQAHYLNNDATVDTTRNYVIIYVGDYDASSWVSQRTPDLWDNPHRGELPMMWCISPVLAERVPHVLHNFRVSASPNDYFAAADNGAGYLMPGVAEKEGAPEDIDTWRRHCKKYYRKWGLSVTGFIIDGNGPAMGKKSLDAYRDFSRNGIVPQKCNLIDNYRGMPVLRSDYDLVSNNPKEAAQVLVERMHLRKDIHFHWFRTILKSPEWYVSMIEEAKRLDPTIQLVDMPTFFELMKNSNKKPATLF
jgi:hypothetical protein